MVEVALLSWLNTAGEMLSKGPYYTVQLYSTFDSFCILSLVSVICILSFASVMVHLEIIRKHSFVGVEYCFGRRNALKGS